MFSSMNMPTMLVSRSELHGHELRCAVRSVFDLEKSDATPTLNQVICDSGGMDFDQVRRTAVWAARIVTVDHGIIIGKPAEQQQPPDR